MATLTSKLILSLVDRVTGPSRGIGAALDSLQRRATRTNHMMLGGAGGGAVIGGAVRNLMAIGAGYIGVTKGIGGTVGAAIKFEEAFADVRKVVDGTPGQLAQIRHEILAMSKTMPTSAEGIAAIYAAAGQSDIPINELGKFSEMVAKVAVAWETTESDTSESLAKIKTQLGMGVAEIGLFADAINHLGNNTAAAAPDLVDYSRRVAANGEMFGFASTETLAFGAAMVSMGAQSEVAATSFRNMGRALTIGSRATKSHRLAFNRLGLDAVKTAKSMQTNALETTLSVIDRIAGLPEWERISIASALFGDEARALMPVISNSKELRRQLGLVAQESNYAGSSFEEYMVRASTAGNAMKILGNQFRAVGIKIGDGWLPTIKEIGLGIGDVLNTLDKRIGVLDKVQVAFSSFLTGLGGKEGAGGIRQLMNDLGDMLFGEVFTGEMGAADQRAIGLAKLSNTLRTVGRDLRGFAVDIRDGNIGEAMGHVGHALSKMSGAMTVGGALALGLVGRGLLGLAAGAVALMLSPIGRIATVAMAVADLIEAAKGADSIGEFVENLGKLSAMDWLFLGAGLGIVGAKIWRIASGLRAIKGAGGVAAAAGGATAVGKGGALAFLGKVGGILSGPLIAAWIAKSYEQQAIDRTRTPQPGEPLSMLGLDPTENREDRIKRLDQRSGIDWRRLLLGRAADEDFNFREEMEIDAGIGGRRRGVGSSVPEAVASPPSDIAARQRVDEMTATLATASVSWPDAARTGLQGYIDAIATGGATAANDASRIGAQIEDALSVTGHPAVETGDLERALSVARELGLAVRNLGTANIAAPQQKIDGTRARGGPGRRDGTYLVGEEGPELITFGRSGFVHSATQTARALRNAALASAFVAAPVMAGPDLSIPAAGMRQDAGGSRGPSHVEMTVASGSIVIHAAPGQSPEQIAAAVERMLSAKLNALSRGAFSDGAS